MKTCFLLLMTVCFLACNSPSKTSTTNQSANVDITGIQWKLIELNGQAVNVQPPNGREPFIMFNSAGNSVTGNGACNNFSGTYTLQQNNGIQFSPLISTKMACNSLTLETQFLKVLNVTGRYEVINDMLILGDGKESTAKFMAAGK